MNRKSTLLLLPLLGAACFSSPARPGDSEQGSPKQVDADAVAALALPEAEDLFGEHVATSGACDDCHSNHGRATAMRDSAGAPIAPYDLWQGTMMANATRDPLWRAVVSAEVAAAPALQGVIEAKCLTCHAPLATVEARLEEQDPLRMAELYTGSDRGMLALDGVSCTLCHQVQPDGLGTEESFSGHYVVEPVGEIYGPHSRPMGRPMEMRSGFLPVEGDHILDSGLCATCHTLSTTAVNDEGTGLSGHSMLEQAPFLEWQASSWSRGEEAQSCQGCHLPVENEDGTPISTRIARTPGGRDMGMLETRSPYGQHLLVGGNTMMLGILKENRELLGLRATDAAMQAVIDRTRDQLQSRTARLTVIEAERTGDALDMVVEVENLTGHKLPTGHPSRRAWLSLVVTDATGAEVFASGVTNDAGELIDTDGTVLASEQRGGPILPHVDLVEDAGMVPVYQPIMQNAAGQPTFRLLAGTGYEKDNRLLPAGWDPAIAAANGVEPVGLSGDPDFGSGGDRVRYRLSGLGGLAPYTVEATLQYQAVSPRYVAELSAWETPEVEAFLVLWEQADRSPEPLAADRVTIP